MPPPEEEEDDKPKKVNVDWLKVEADIDCLPVFVFLYLYLYLPKRVKVNWLKVELTQYYIEKFEKIVSLRRNSGLMCDRKLV